MKARTRVVGRRTEGGRTRQGHRADHVRRRPDAAADAALQAPALDVAHARIVSIDVSKAPGASRRRRDRDGRRPADPLRHPPGVAGRARAVHRPRPLRGRPRRRGRRPRRGRRLRRAGRHRGPLRAAAADRHDRRGTGARRRGSRSTITATPATSTSASRWSSATWRPDAVADRVFEDIYFYEGNTHLPMEQHASLARLRTRRQAHALVLDADAALRPPRALQGAGDAGGRISASSPPPTAAASAARATPSTTRSWWRRLSRITGRPVKICLTREEVFYCHRGRHPVLMQVKTGVRRTGRSRRCTFRPCSTAGPTAPTASPRPTTPARCRP